MRSATFLTGDDAISALADERFAVTPHIAFTTGLGERLGLDFSATLAVMRFMPLWAGKDRHAELRKLIAAFLAVDRRAKSERAARRIGDLLDERLVGADGTIDLLDLVRESAQIYMEEITGLFAPRTETSDLPNIFSSNLGVAARCRLEGKLRRLFEIVRLHHPQDDEERGAIRIAQWLMGRDPMIGAMAESLRQHLILLDGGPLCKTPLRELPTYTGLPLIGRVASSDLTFGDHVLPEGTLVKCRLDSFNGGSEAERLRFFGAGAHLCLGRPQALDYFAIIAARINDCDFGLCIESYRLKDDDVFDMPEEFTVSKTTSGCDSRD